MNSENESTEALIRALRDRVKELEAQLLDKNTKLADASMTGISLCAEKTRLADENYQLRSRCCLAEKAFAENAELRKDKERLEWLGEHALKCLNLKEPLRDAIDSAMKAKT